MAIGTEMYHLSLRLPRGFQPDGKWLATAGGVTNVRGDLPNGVVKIWDAATGKELRPTRLPWSSLRLPQNLFLKVFAAFICHDVSARRVLYSTHMRLSDSLFSSLLFASPITWRKGSNVSRFDSSIEKP